MIEEIQRANRKSAAVMIEVAKAALARIDLAALEPEQRVELRTADELLSRSLESIEAVLGNAPSGDHR